MITQKVVLMDIEGTTTPIPFVHEVLFPYARARMHEFLSEQGNQPDVAAAVADARQTVVEEGGDEQAIAAALVSWIDQDRKHPALKKLQGMIWKRGYEKGDYRAELYADVLPAWRRWREAGKILAIYSSGSVQAQKLLFGHTEEGDATVYLSHYFDTSSGHKKETGSYTNIAAALGVESRAVVFLSDVPAELDAAREAGMASVHVVRPGTEPCADHRVIHSFDEL
jgi:enolase-phosphatase E1